MSEEEKVTDATVTRTIRARIEAIDEELAELYAKVDEKAAPLKLRRAKLAEMVAEEPKPGPKPGSTRVKKVIERDPEIIKEVIDLCDTCAGHSELCPPIGAVSTDDNKVVECHNYKK